MITFRRLKSDDSTKLYTLIQEIEGTLEDRTFWLPINKVSFQHFFDETWTIFYGAFLDNNLVGASALFLNPHEYGESLEHTDLHISKSSVAELGRLMIKPEFRGKHISNELNKRVVQEAREQNKQYLLATVHPDNIPSQKSLKRLGLHKIARYTKSCGYIRDVLLGEVAQLI